MCVSVLCFSSVISFKYVITKNSVIFERAAIQVDSSFPLELFKHPQCNVRGSVITYAIRIMFFCAVNIATYLHQFISSGIII